jgi:hypothetical protein
MKGLPGLACKPANERNLLTTAGNVNQHYIRLGSCILQYEINPMTFPDFYFTFFKEPSIHISFNLSRSIFVVRIRDQSYKHVCYFQVSHTQTSVVHCLEI